MSEAANPNVKATAANVGTLLENAHIPNVLFGWTALGLVLVDFDLPLIDFIIPDDNIKDAVAALETAGYKGCGSSSCPELDPDRGSEAPEFERYHPVAGAHFHLAAGRVLSLLKKDDTIPHMSSLKLGLPGKKEYEYLTLSVDPRLPARPENWKPGSGSSGPWYDLPPARVFLGRTLTEVLLLLRCRDYHREPHLGSPADHLWRHMVWEIRRIKQRTGQEFDRPLQGHLQDLWMCLSHSNGDFGDQLKYKCDNAIGCYSFRLQQDGKDPHEKHGWLWKKFRNYA